MTKEDKLWFCRMNGDSVYPKVKLIISPEAYGMPQTMKISSLVYVKKDNETYVIPLIETHIIRDYGVIKWSLYKFNKACELIKKEYICTETDLTLNDLQ